MVSRALVCVDSGVCNTCTACCVASCVGSGVGASVGAAVSSVIPKSCDERPKNPGMSTVGEGVGVGSGVGDSVIIGVGVAVASCGASVAWEGPCKAGKGVAVTTGSFSAPLDDCAGNNCLAIKKPSAKPMSSAMRKHQPHILRYRLLILRSTLRIIAARALLSNKTAP